MAEDAVVVNELAQAGTPAPDAGTTAAPDTPVEGGESQQAEAPKTYTQEELDAAIGKRLAKAEKKAQRETDRRIAEAVAKAIPKQEAAPSPKPKLDQFNTTEEYVEAVAKHAVVEDKHSQAANQQQTTKQARQSEIDSQYGEALSRGEDKYDDFDAAMFSVSRLPIPDDVGLALKEAIAESEDGEELLYYLGKHKDEALRIAKLSPARALVELGKLGAKLPTAAPEAKKTTSAPAPISPVKPGGGTTYTDLDDPRALKALGPTGLINAWRAKAAAQAQKR